MKWLHRCRRPSSAPNRQFVAVHALRLEVEPLEARRMLAGDVQVSLVNGDLVVKGDSDDNSIEVSRLSSANPNLPDFISVQGTDGTTVNGTGNNFSVLASALSDDIRLTLGGGNDEVKVSTGTPGALVAKLGSGSDLLLISNSVFPENSSVNMGAGDDELSGTMVQFYGNLKVRANGGSDGVYLYNSVVGNVLDVTMANGVDYVELDDFEAAKLKVTTGGGDDQADLTHVEVVRQGSVSMGGGDDQMDLNYADADVWSFSMGAGDDDLDFYETFGTTKARFNGGGGFDHLVDDSDGFFPGPVSPDTSVVGFELVTGAG